MIRYLQRYFERSVVHCHRSNVSPYCSMLNDKKRGLKQQIVNCSFFKTTNNNNHYYKMNQGNNNLVEENNNYDNNVLIHHIRKESNETKINFIQNVISLENPVNFTPLPRSDVNKIFYRIKDGQKQRREWIHYEDNKFFCVYCVCFSALDEKNRLIKGVDRAVESLKN